MKPLAAALTLFAILTAHGRAQASTLVAHGTDVSFRRPQASADGMVAVAERFRAGSCPLSETCPSSWDVVVIDGRASSGGDFIHEVTRDGVSRDPSVTSDGLTVAYWSESDGGIRFHAGLVTASGPLPVVHVDAEAQAVARLDIDPSGRYLAYWRRLAGGGDEIVSVDLFAPVARPVVVDAGRGLGLAAEHPIDRNGVVYYTKSAEGAAWLQRFDPRTGNRTILPVLGAEPTSASVSEDGMVHAYVARTPSVGAANVYVGGAQARQVTFNVDPSVSFGDVGVSRDGGWITFSSNGDLAGGNADGSAEVFRARLGGQIHQVTDLRERLGGSSAFDGVSAAAGASVVLFAQGRCPLGDCGPAFAANTFAVRLASPDAFAPAQRTVVGSIAPPFDLQLGPSPCSLDGDQLRCRFDVRNSLEQERNVLVVREFDVLAGSRCQGRTTRLPIVVTLAAGSQVTIDDVLDVGDCGSVTGGLRIAVIGPDASQADMVQATAGFPR